MTRLIDVLDETQTYGAATNLALLRQAIDDRRFRAGQVSTKFLELLDYEANEIEIVRPSLETTVQAFPGRQGYWEVGVPPSGPMDDLSFQLGNNLLGNPPNAAGLEIVLQGAKVKFRNAAECVLTGAHCVARLGDRLVEREAVFTVAAGEILSIDEVKQGVRSYLLISGGLDIEEYLGSAATFVLGKFGGHQGRALRQGDVLRRTQLASIPKSAPTENSRTVDLTSRKNIRVLLGPHAAPDFFTEAWIGELFKASWQVDQIRTEQVSGLLVRRRHGRGIAAERLGCIHQTSMIRPTFLARWILRAICRLFWGPTVPHSEVSSVRLL